MKYLIIFALFTQLLTAAPAFQGKRTFTQPDGTTITYRVQGDEHLNWVESESGDILLFSKKNKRYEYAQISNGTLKASGIPFSANTPLSANAAPARVTKEELSALHRKRRDEHLSKMKNRRDLHQ